MAGTAPGEGRERNVIIIVTLTYTHTHTLTLTHTLTHKHTQEVALDRRLQDNMTTSPSNCNIANAANIHNDNIPPSVHCS